MSGIGAMSELTLLNGNAGLVLDNTVLAPPDALTVTDFSTLSPQDIDDACPYTTWTKDRVIYTLPKFMVFMDLFEKVVYPKGDPMEGQDLVVSDSDFPPHHVYLGFTIACSNLVVRPAFLAPDPAPAVDNQGNRVIRTYEQDFDYLCLEFTLADGARSFWYCAHGNLADGVTGIASKPVADPLSANLSPATFFVNQIQWGPNVWNKHWEFPDGLGAISARIAGNEQTGFAKDYQWNLNPNDWHRTGGPKAPDYIAAVGAKTATNRNGAYVSPYNTQHLTEYFSRISGFVSPPLDTLAYAAQLDPSELNQGEVETRSCDNHDPSQCFTYFQKPDIAALGTVGTHGYGVVDISVGPFYSSSSDCSWQADWGFPSFSTFTAGYVKPEPVLGTEIIDAQTGTISGPTLPLINSLFKVAINLGDNELPRCPSWNLCQTSGTQPIVHLYGLDFQLTVQGIMTSGVRFSAPPPGATNCSHPGTYWCEQVLCGRSLAVESSDRLPDGTPQRRDWWFRSVPAGIQPGNWQLACSNISSCSVPVVANLTIVGVPSGLSPDSVAQALSGQALP
ncbi:MAG TPA: hypothetical protein VKB87_12840 [Myxococcaceae bacterium]|nr:hypothetical protein [Myxococcaceae bacterium]